MLCVRFYTLRLHDNNLKPTVESDYLGGRRLVGYGGGLPQLHPIRIHLTHLHNHTITNTQETKGGELLEERAPSETCFACQKYLKMAFGCIRMFCF